MAYLLEITRPRCRDCRSPARFELFNRFNSLMGTYCTSHAKRALKQAEERQHPPKAATRMVGPERDSP